MDNRQRLVGLLKEFRDRLLELNYVRAGPFGFADLISLASEIELLRTKLALPKLLECEEINVQGGEYFHEAGMAGFLKRWLLVKVWDPLVNKAQMQGTFPQINYSVSLREAYTLSLNRMIRYVESQDAIEQPPKAIESPSSQPVQRDAGYVTLARESQEEGYRVIAQYLNKVLEEKPPALSINAETMRPGDSLRGAAEKLRRALPGLRLHVELKLPPDDAQVFPWTLGYVNGANNARVDISPMGVLGYLNEFNEEVTKLCEFLRGDSTRNWTKQDWQNNIVQPVEELQQNSLAAIEAVAKELSKGQTTGSEINPDGPCEPKTWRHNGIAIKASMTTTAWELVNYLWKTRQHSASTEELAEPVFGELEFTDEAKVRNHASNANDYFKKHSLPWHVKVSKRPNEIMVFLESK